MRSWGGENIDQSLRTWLCGGEIVYAEGSRVAFHACTWSPHIPNRMPHIERHRACWIPQPIPSTPPFMKQIVWKQRHIDLNLQWLIYIDLHWSSSIYIDLQWSTLIYIDLQWSNYIDLHWPTLIYIDLHRSPLNIIDLESMLIYVGLYGAHRSNLSSRWRYESGQNIVHRSIPWRAILWHLLDYQYHTMESWTSKESECGVFAVGL